MLTLAAAPLEGASAGLTGFLGPVGPVFQGLLGLFGPHFSGNPTTALVERYGAPVTRTMTIGGVSRTFSGTVAQVRAAIAAAQASAVPHAPLLREGMPVSFLSGVGKIFGGLTGVGGIIHEIGSVIHPATTAAGRAATVAVDATRGAVRAGARTVARHPVIAAAGAAAAAGTAMGMGGEAMMHPAAAKHLRKALGLHHRRMHVTNTRALNRALRRVKGFERVARRVLQITHHKPVKVHFKFRRHRKAA